MPVSSLIKKIILSVFLFFYLFVSNLASPSPSFAADSGGTWYNQGFTEWYVKVYDDLTSPSSEIFGERYTAAQVQWIVYGLISLPINFLGKDLHNFLICTMKASGAGAVDLGQCATGAIEFLVKIVEIISPIVSAPDQTPLASRMFDVTQRPLSGIGYIQNTTEKLSLVKIANAQTTGFGYAHMGIIIPYWKASRDISFVFLILAVIIFAFMIMFRVKINPQTVITIQSALPKVIGALILATFSLAIAGFVIDLMYVVSGAFATLMASSGIASSAGRAYTSILGEFSIKGVSLGSVAGGPLTIFIVMLIYALLFLFSVIWNALSSILLSLSLIAGTGFTIVGLALFVWVVVLMIWYTLKIPWVLFKTAINIYLSIIIAPLQIMAGVFAPAMGFGLWLRNLIANVLVFPVTGLFIYLAFDFLMFSYTAGTVVGIDALVAAINNLFGSSLKIGNPNSGQITLWSPPWIGADVTGFMFLMMSFGLIVMLPKVIDMLKSVIMGEKFAFGTAIGEAQAPLKAAWGMTGAPIAAEALRAQGASRVLLGIAGEGRPLYGIMNRINPRWDDILKKVKETGGLRIEH
ncbi:MAG: hypothetical protein UU32_C0018G0002 [Candidatus Woesebacteria bacterium GW2011_GWB1_41_10]|uniref:Uncharacterized protein n=1 Tax=Candidatus Woesebacteria bacterium GW2011_GWB1_41_10 TaxID=1618577 RepID=A0A0G0UBD9_9BACT|nr:MAG: hypothetical protein UU32_C0018G0002 [Candidatus Woesebacteria bacterium GW2011_GWB1_41_10]